MNATMNDDDTAEEGSGDTGRLIRPYLMTGGRTTVDDDIRIETQLQTTPKGRRELSSFRWEAAQILELADQPLSLAEISARAEIPLGAARVIVSDLIGDGVLIAQRAVASVSNSTNASLLQKVLDGVRSL